MTITSPWLTGNYAPVTEEVTAADLPVTGTIPDGLDGRYVRNGPNPRGEADPATYHWFTGEGMVHGLRLRDGRADWFRNRWVGPNTNVISQGGRTWALVESGPVPVELTDELDPIAVNGFDGTLEDGYTAHPKRDPHTGELHAVSYCWAWDHVRYSVVGVDGRVRRELHVPVPGQPMVHDCALTENFVVLFDLPVTFDLDAAMAGTVLPYRWDPDYGARVGLLPREGDADDVRWFDVDLCYVYHPLNAHEDDEGRVVVELVRHPKMFDRNRLGPDDGASRLDRWTIDPANDKVIEEMLDDTYVELPRHDERLIARPYRYGYAMELTSGFGPVGAVKFDLQTGQTLHRTFGEGRVTDEMVFVPRSPDAAEDEGWLLSYVYDAAHRPQRPGDPGRRRLPRRPRGHRPPAAARPPRLPRQLDAGGLAAGQDLDVEDDEDAVLVLGPLPEAGGQLGQLVGGGQAVVQGLGSEGRPGRADPVGPQAAPPRPGLGVGERPRRRSDLDVGEAGGAHPGRQVAAGVGLGAVALRDLVVEVQPAGQPGVGRCPREGRVVAVADRHQPVGPQHAPELDQCRNRVGQVLEDLVGVDDVVAVVGGVEAVHVADREGHVGRAPLGRLRGGGGDDLLRGVQADHRAGGDPVGQVAGQRARAAAHVQQRLSRLQVGEEVGRRVRGGAPAVAPQHALVVAVRVPVGHARRSSRGVPGRRRWPGSPGRRRSGRGGCSRSRRSRTAGSRQDRQSRKPSVRE